MSTPAFDWPGTAPRSTATSTIALSLRTIRAGPAGRGVADLAVDRARGIRAAGCAARRAAGGSCAGATGPVRTLNRSVTSAPISGRQVSRPRSTYRRAVLRVVVAGPDVDVAAQARPSRRTTSAVFECVLRPTSPYTTWAPARSSLRAQTMFASSSKRALISTRTTTCLPRSAARMSDWTIGESPRRPVQRLLDRQDVRIVGGLGDEPLDRRRERLVRVVDEDVAGADRGEHVGRLVLVGRDEPRRGHRRSTARASRSGRSSSAIAHSPVRSSIPLTS